MVVAGPGLGVLLLVLDALDAGLEEAGLHADEALDAPLGGGHLPDEEGLDGILGLELGFERSEEFGVGLLVLLGQDGIVGGEAVADGVEAGAGFAERSAGPGAAAGVFAIGLDLKVGWHWGSPCRLQESTGGLERRGPGLGKWLGIGEKCWWKRGE